MGVVVQLGSVVVVPMRRDDNSSMMRVVLSPGRTKKICTADLLLTVVDPKLFVSQ